jgi:hypothetical protein
MDFGRQERRGEALAHWAAEPLWFADLAERKIAHLNRAANLALIRALHTAIYLVMAASVLAIFFAGATGAMGTWLWVALVLAAGESAVFFGNGMKCPLTAVAVRYGASTGHVFDTFLPERATRYTFRVFGTLLVVGVALLAARWGGWIG